MAITEIKSKQIKDGGVYREDLNINTTGKAVIRKVLPGDGISIDYTGVDVGTGDVIVNLNINSIIITNLVLNIDGIATGQITTGNKGYFRIPYGCDIKNWYLFSDQIGSIEIEMLYDSSFPPQSSIDAFFILNNENKKEGNADSWSINKFSEGDLIAFNVNSVNLIKKIVLIIQLERSLLLT